MRYDPTKIEKKWQKRWLKEGIYEPDLKAASPGAGRPRAKRPFYNLMMFPYPSAEGLHIGSVRTFSGIDIYGRFKRMQGFDVFEPIGLDGFGIHSENYALKIGKHPFQHAKDSEKNFYRQLSMIGNGFAWREKLETYDPEYYRWTQWIFTQMFRRGLVYRKKSPVNWCPSCKTVLADEQVLQGECERCQSKVIKKELEQWFFKITQYAERLLKNLEKIDWPEPIKIAQRNWIGKSEGALIRFPLKSNYNYVFLHAYKGSPDEDFWPWLKEELLSRGAKIYAPQLPNPAEPNIEEQIKFVLDHYRFDENTVIVTHSLGGVVAMKLLPKLKSCIAGLVMVAPPLRTEFLDGKRRPALEKATDWKFDFMAIKNSAEQIVVIQDAKDSVVPPSHPEEIARVLGARLSKVVAPAPHFNCSKSEDVLYGALLYGESLKFDLPKIPGIFSGDKYITVRLHPKNLRAGDLCELIDSTTGKKFALAEITGVEKKKMKDVPERGRGLQEFKSRPEFYKTLTAYYKMAVDDDTDAWLYQFRLVSEHIEVFTTRPDTLFGATYMVLAPEHPLIKNLELRIQNLEEVREYIKKAKAKTEEERIAEGKVPRPDGRDGGPEGLAKKTGVELKGIRAINPATKEEIPIWVADYVLGNVGTGAIMAVPAHDQRDFYFAKKYNLPIKMVVCPHYPAKTCPVLDRAYTGEGHLVDSGKFNGMSSEKARWEITKFVGGERKTKYRLRDWLISRQRYWGPPIPMIYCPACAKASAGKENAGWQPVPEKDLPVRLPYIKDFRPTGTDKSPLASVEKFYKVRCPKCRSWARRETDVSDTFLDSAWYYLGYLILGGKRIKDKRQKFTFDKGFLKKWLPVDMYIGGAEHAVLHLLYVRFLAMAFYDWELTHFEEPFKTFRTHGIITKDGAKMSKSRGNVVNPDEYIKAYGIDAIRMYLAFLAPLTQGGDFRDTGIKGITRFLERAWKLCGRIKDKGQRIKEEKLKLQKIVQRTIKKVTEDIESLRYNTAISALMILLNELETNADAVSREDTKILLKLLAPFAPHMAEELWQRIRDKRERTPHQNKFGTGRVKDKRLKSIHLESWPRYDALFIKEETFKLVIQVNGKVRGRVTLPAGVAEEEAKKAALAEPSVRQHMSAEPRKVIFVPNKLINFVV